MDPVIGLDVAKGESQVQAFLARKHPFGKTFKFKHDTNGLCDFYVFYKEVKLKAEADPVVIFESTGHFHEPVLQYLEERKITYYLVNLVVSYETKKSSLRKVKSDPADALTSMRTLLQRRSRNIPPEKCSNHELTQFI
jgi:transposase